MYLCIVIVENTQAQYFDILIRKLYASVLNNTIRSCIKFANINALFLASFSDPVLFFFFFFFFFFFVVFLFVCFSQNNEMEIDSNLPIWKGVFHNNL